MRHIEAQAITQAVKGAATTANYVLGQDVLAAFERGLKEEESPAGREVFRQLLENARLAREQCIPLCQDCGLAVIFAEVGQEVAVMGGDFATAIQEGIRQGYRESHLRKSVCHPLTRANTGDNTPAIIHAEIVPGDKLKLFVVPKGGGSENMSRQFMLKPAEGWTGIKERVVGAVQDAGPGVCPPMILGIGIGGNFERSALLAKKSLLRELGAASPEPEVASLEAEILEAANRLGIGPQGLGGRITVLGVNVIMEPCHIASLPVAVNIQCHSARHQEVIL